MLIRHEVFGTSVKAMKSVGFGGCYQGEWFSSHWPPGFAELEQSSALSEIYPVAVDCVVWGRYWKCKHISVMCDNQAVVDIINRGRSASRDIMRFMRRIMWSAVTHNFIITARDVTVHDNTLADALSRFKFQVFPQALSGSRSCGAISSSIARPDAFLSYSQLGVYMESAKPFISSSFNSSLSCSPER